MVNKLFTNQKLLTLFNNQKFLIDISCMTKMILKFKFGALFNLIVIHVNVKKNKLPKKQFF